MTMQKLAVTMFLSVCAMATVAQSDGYRDRRVERRAADTVIWGMPAVGAERLRQAVLHSTSARENEIVYWSRPVSWKSQMLAPDPDALPFMVFFNTRTAGPLVIDIPSADGGTLAGSFVTTWQTPLDDTGPRGADGGRGGRYLIVPPDYAGTPPQGFIVLRADTYGGVASLQSKLASRSDEDIARAVAYGKRIKVYPLSLAQSPPPTRFTDVQDVLLEGTIPYDASFFKLLNDVVQKEPWIERDRVMIDHLKDLGIEKSQPYRPDARLDRILSTAIVEAHAELASRYDAGFDRVAPQHRWFSAAIPEVVRAMSSGYARADEYPVDARGTMAMLGVAASKRVDAAPLYLVANKDKDGRDMQGNAVYRLQIPARVPASRGWSVTAYDRDTHALIRQMSRAGMASTTPDLETNADGAVEIYFGPHAPHGKESNWVPTDPSRNFELVFRLHGPDYARFGKQWRLPDVEKLE